MKKAMSAQELIEALQQRREIIWTSDKASFNLIVVNSGHRTAKKVLMKTWVRYWQSVMVVSSKVALKEVQEQPIPPMIGDVGEVTSNETIAGEERRYRIDVNKPPDFSKEVTLAAVGTFTYDNGFGHLLKGAYCFYYNKNTGNSFALCRR
jgi:hypothetical protein